MTDLKTKEMTAEEKKQLEQKASGAHKAPPEEPKAEEKVASQAK